MSATNEFGLIEWFRENSATNDRVRLGIGDDTAIVDVFNRSESNSSETLVTVDMLMEGVHFTCPPATGFQVGRKALAVNLSDIAAMAGRPTAAVVSVAINRKHGPEFAQEVHRGLQELANEFNVAVVGGDTNVWDKPTVISVTQFGEVTERGAVQRSGAKPGDWIIVTGELGGSIHGKHLNFTPRVLEALALHEAADIHAMLDISDGISSDLLHILKESGIGARIDAGALPISEAVSQTNDDRSPVQHALDDGEDFELLFTVSPEDGKRLIIEAPIDIRLSKIGEINSDSDCILISPCGTDLSLTRGGWEHSFSMNESS